MMDEPITRKSQECCPFFLSYFSENSILRWKKDRKKGVEIGGVVLLKRRSLTPSHSVQSSLSRVSHTMTHTQKIRIENKYFSSCTIFTLEIVSITSFFVVCGDFVGSPKNSSMIDETLENEIELFGIVSKAATRSKTLVGEPFYSRALETDPVPLAAARVNVIRRPTTHTVWNGRWSCKREGESSKKQRVCRCFRESHWFQKIKKRNREIKIEKQKESARAMITSAYKLERLFNYQLSTPPCILWRSSRNDREYELISFFSWHRQVFL